MVAGPVGGVGVFITKSGRLRTREGTVGSIVSSLGARCRRLSIDLGVCSCRGCSSGRATCGGFVISRSSVILFVLRKRVESGARRRFLVTSGRFRGDKHRRVDVFIGGSTNRSSNSAPRVGCIGKLLGKSISGCCGGCASGSSCGDLGSTIGRYVQDCVGSRGGEGHGGFEGSYEQILAPVTSILLYLFTLTTKCFCCRTGGGRSLLLVTNKNSTEGCVSGCCVRSNRGVRGFSFSNGCVCLRVNSGST